jgi:hypothetical protein
LKGSTIDGHAKRTIRAEYTCYEFSKKSLRRTAEGELRSVAEDLFAGCFDAVAIDVLDGLTLLVQWTSGNSGSLSYRRKKIRENFCFPLLKAHGPALCANAPIRVELWAYAGRRVFSVERYDWIRDEWIDAGSMIAPGTGKP